MLGFPADLEDETRALLGAEPTLLLGPLSVPFFPAGLPSRPPPALPPLASLSLLSLATDGVPDLAGVQTGLPVPVEVPVKLPSDGAALKLPKGRDPPFQKL